MEAFGVVIFIFFAVASLLQPLIGLYAFLFIAYIRPQDFNPYLANIEPAKVMLVFTLISFLVHKIVKREPIVKARQNWALLGIFACILMSRIGTIDGVRWWLATEDFIRILVVYFIFINLMNTEKRLRSFYILFLLLNLFIAARFYMSYRNGTAMYWGSKPGDYSFGFLANADDLSIGLVVALPFALIPIFYARNLFLKGLCVLTSIIFMLGVLATRSRGALLGVFVVFIVSILSQLKVSKLRVRQYATGFVITLSLFLAFNYKYSYVINEQYASTKDESDAGRLGRDSTWAVAKQMVIARPLTGVGRGNFVTYWMMNYPPGVFGYQVAHNIIWEVAAEIGLIGLVFFLYFSIYGFFEIRKLTKKYKENLARNNFLEMIFTTYIISLIGFYVNGMFITVAFYWHIYVLVAMFVSAKTIFMKELAYTDEAAKKR